MELFSCPNHTGSYCLLKTGTKPGPTQGASFYICGNCQFNVHTKLPPTTCTVHKTHTVELQSIINVKNLPEQLRRYFRCPGRNAGESWCGYETITKPPIKLVKDCKDQSSVNSNLKGNQGQLHNNKENIEINSLVKPLDEKRTLASGQNVADQSFNVKSEEIHCEDSSLIVVSDDEDCQEKEVPDNEKSIETQMEISFANLSKSRHLPVSTCSEMNMSFENKSFKQYRNSPHPAGRNKSGQPSVKPGVTSDSEDSDASDLKGSQGARTGLEKLKISYQEADTKSGAGSVADTSSVHVLSLMGGNTREAKELPVETLKSEATERRASEKKPEASQKSNSTGSSASSIPGSASSIPGSASSIPGSASSIPGSASSIPGSASSIPGSASSIPSDQVTGLKNLQEKTTVSQHSSVDIVPKVSARNLQSLICQKEMQTSELQKLQSNLRSISIHSLPDQGRRVFEKLKAMQMNIQALDNEIKMARSQLGSQDQSSNSLSTTSLNKTGAPASHHMDKSTSLISAQSSIKSDVTNCRNNNFVVPVLQTALQPHQQHQYPPQFMHLPQHLQQLFAANPQAMTLYGGRMTAQQLREIGSITTEAIDKLHKQLESCPTEQTECSDPHGLKVELKSHQRHALAWLTWREQQVPPGGILADDMGLGKTLTTISHILRHKVTRAQANKDEWLSRDKQVEKLDKAVKKSGATLIVTPASVVHQWATEIERRVSPGLLKFTVYHGPNRERNIQKLIDSDIVLTTYTIVSKEVGTDKQKNAEGPVKDDEDEEETENKSDKRPEELPLLLRIGWERIVLDEAHNIKNHKSLTAQSVCRLRAVYRWALTGTPIQNDLLDMYSLLRFLRFSPFDEYKVWKKHIDSAKGGAKRLNIVVKALLLRRTKDQSTIEGKPLVSLPSKTFNIIKVELSAEEKAVYDRLFKKTQSTVQEYVQRHAEKEFEITGDKKQTAIKHNEEAKVSNYGGVTHGASQTVGATLPAQSRSTGSQILVSLLRLRQCCSHLSLMKSHLDAINMESDGIELTLEEQIKGMVLDEIDKDCNGGTSVTSSPIFNKSSLSTKLKYVLEKLASIKSDKDSAGKDKSVIVSQWTQMLEIVAHHLDKAGIRYCMIQGDIPAKKRMDIVDDFNLNPKGAQVLLLSLQAGGVGLNLIGGNHLFLLDIHWNPALEEQACDRIYRMGQIKDVFIYRFLCQDTIEEKIVALQDMKRSLAKSVLSGAGASRQKLTLSDLRSLFGV